MVGWLQWPRGSCYRRLPEGLLYVFVPAQVTRPVPIDRKCEGIHDSIFGQKNLHHDSKECSWDMGHTNGGGFGAIGKKDYSSGPFCHISDEYDGELNFNLMFESQFN